MTDLTTGERVNYEQMLDLPPGTEFSDTYNTYRVLTQGHMTRVGTPHMYAPWQLREVYTITKVGNGTPEQDNLFTFTQRLATMCMGGAWSAGASYVPSAAEALERLGCVRTPRIGVGMYVHMADQSLADRIPEGAIVGVGNPNFATTYREAPFRQWRRDGDRCGKGGLEHMPPLVRVLALPEGTEETTAYLTPSTPQDEEAIALLRGRAWEIGYRAKQDHSWCEMFEVTVSALGITERTGVTVSAAPAPPVIRPVDARTLDADEQRALPAGAVVCFDQLGNRWNWMRRNPNSTYTTGTSYLLGPNTGSWSSTGVYLIWDGTGTMSIPVPSMDVLRALPVGTVLGHVDYLDSRDRYPHYFWTKQGDDRWVSHTGSVVSDSGFAAGGVPSETWHIAAFPE